ncbi:hypothetical protein [Glycomyces salinus]|uniref:hypothetical protein n=1 Tax=Glycomyces salinus TaxID=980294 RepID=UPI0018ECAF56|nr:hypothetical protein [Glycomyces salinus]
MTTWEYFSASLVLDARGSMKKRAQSSAAFHQSLDFWGSQGWEMIGFHVQSYKGHMSYNFLFKRPTG